MKRTKVVIGSVFGDEGKGLMTDYHASQNPDAIVVRFNGGAQAGHTVVTPGGTRHVFSHFGSGSICGLPTYLSSDFIVNPILWMEEFGKLEDIGASRSLYVNPKAVVTTPFDMLINQFAEVSRGANNHGSVGVGINETVVRSEIPEFRIEAGDLLDPENLGSKLADIVTDYIPMRLAALGVELSYEQSSMLRQTSIIFSYARIVDAFNSFTRLSDDGILRDRAYETVIFEGAQGLLLDQNHAFFPHVTRSSTGLTNVQRIAADVGIDTLEVDYMMRAYMTRHGAGPFPSYDPEMRFEDDTNVPHPWQGSMRFGALDLDLIVPAIVADMSSKVAVKPRIVMTHVDQAEKDGLFWAKYPGQHRLEHWSTILTDISYLTGIRETASSDGPTRDNISISF
jgi:adenylosuccinate synthase